MARVHFQGGFLRAIFLVFLQALFQGDYLQCILHQGHSQGDCLQSILRPGHCRGGCLQYTQRQVEVIRFCQVEEGVALQLHHLLSLYHLHPLPRHYPQQGVSGFQRQWQEQGHYRQLRCPPPHPFIRVFLLLQQLLLLQPP